MTQSPKIKKNANIQKKAREMVVKMHNRLYELNQLSYGIKKEDTEKPKTATSISHTRKLVEWAMEGNSFMLFPIRRSNRIASMHKRK